LQAPSRFTVQFSPLATEQAEWLLAGWGIDFRPRMTELLSRDPSPHRSRRIRRRSHGARWEIGCGAWRGFFQVDGQTVTVLTLDAAYPLRFLHDLTLEDIPDRAAQLAFLARWPADDEPAE
jgi:hypothetical protein